MRKRGEMTPFVKNFIIIFSSIIAMILVIIIVYNVVNISSAERRAEELFDLDIVKSSVHITDGVLYLKVKESGENEKELKKIKFILYDGENTEEIVLDASDLQELGEKEFEISLGKLSTDKTISVSVVPIVKSFVGIKELDVVDRISIKPSGEVKKEKIEKDIETISTEIKKCSDCGGILGCSRAKCHSIRENNLKCYYAGGILKKCTICTSMSCEGYKNEEDCSENRCDLGRCVWENSKCIVDPQCGDLFVNASAYEECDPPQEACIPEYGSNCTYCRNCVFVSVIGGYCGDEIINGAEECDDGGSNGIACTPDYGEDCTYCSSECLNVSLEGGSCGDGICDEGSETPGSCPADCEGCGDGVCSSDETCSTCSADCGDCCGDGICDADIGEDCSTCSADCGDCCGDGICNADIGEDCSTCSADCGDCLKELGETCSSGGECLSGYCVDGVCCDNTCTGLCKACDLSGSLGTCTNVPNNQDPDNECPNAICRSSYCDGFGACQLASACSHDDCPAGQVCNALGSCYNPCEGKPDGWQGTCVDDSCKYCYNGVVNRCLWSYYYETFIGYGEMAGSEVWCTPSRIDEVYYSTSAVGAGCTTTYTSYNIIPGSPVVIREQKCGCSPID